MDISKKEQTLYKKVIATKSPAALERLLGSPDIVFYNPDNYQNPSPACEVKKREVIFNPDEVQCYNYVFANYRVEAALKSGEIVNLFFVSSRPVKLKKAPNPKRKPARKTPGTKPKTSPVRKTKPKPAIRPKPKKTVAKKAPAKKPVKKKKTAKKKKTSKRK